MLRFEQQAWSQGFEGVAGMDEAGRGPLAGPVVAAAVFINRDFLEQEADGLLSGLTDSKQLSEARREHFFTLLTESDSCHVGIGEASVEEIDRLNILRATYLAMERAFAQLSPAPDFVLIDGRGGPLLACPSASIVKGDSRSLSIAAASVCAKVTRDRMMVELDGKYPGFGFAQHKGYGTREHLDALKKRGPSRCHRLTFEPIRSMQGVTPDTPAQPGLFDGEETDHA